MNKELKIFYPLKIVKQVLYLPRTMLSNKEESAFVTGQLTELRDQIDSLKTAITEDRDAAGQLKKLLHSVDERLVDIQGSVKTRAVAPASKKVVNNTVADNHTLDHFYKLFEDEFRGSEEDIKQRVSEHLPLFESLSAKLKKLPIVDIGCGRGEFLSVIKKAGLKVIGVDMNESMVKRAQELGYDAVLDDAVSYLTKQKKESLAAITGFHIVEHIPFESLIHLFEEAYRTLAHDGFVLFETPNPNNLSVGACNFYMDPSHIKPIPPPLLAFALESVGFSSTIVPLHPARATIAHDDPAVLDMMNMLYGPLDYAVIARKI